MVTAQEKRKCLRHGKAERNFSGLIRFAATQLAVVGWLATTLPSTAVTASYRNDFRSCTGRLLSVGISDNAAASACAAALNPGDLSRCVAEIERRTEIAAADALSTCRQARRPEELAECVVSISRNSEDQAVPGVLNYCGRSLLPERFAECVVGLRREIEIVPAQAMETCVDASDPLADVSPRFVTPTQSPLIRPAPPAPDVRQDPTPLAEPSSIPTVPQNQTSPQEQTPAPAAPGNPGAQ